MMKRSKYADFLSETLYDTQYQGNINYLAGGKGKGKTHEAVFHFEHLAKIHDFAIITNIQFLDEDGDFDMPDPVYFAKDFPTLWRHVADIRDPDEEGENNRRPILICIDEYQKTVHRQRTLREEVLAMDRWYRMFRKLNFSGLFITQYINHSVPRILLVPTEFIILKRKNLVNEYNRRHNSTPPQDDEQYWNHQELSFIINVQEGIYTLTYPSGQVDPNPINDFEDHDITVDDCDGVLETARSPWTDIYSSEGSATFELGKVNGIEAKTWIPDLMSRLGGAPPKKVPSTIRDFLDNYEGPEGKEKDIDKKGIIAYLDKGEDYWELSPGQGQKAMKIPKSHGNMAEVLRMSPGSVSRARGKEEG